MQKRFISFVVTLTYISLTAFSYAAQGVVVDRNFEDAQAGGHGGVYVTGDNPNIHVEVVEGISSPFSWGNKSLKYTSRKTGGVRTDVYFWDHARDGFANINSNNARISLDIMFESLEGIHQIAYFCAQAGDYPIPDWRFVGGSGIRIHGAPDRYPYFMIGFGHDNRLGIYFMTNIGHGRVHPDAVWKIEEGRWYRIEFELFNLHMGGKNTKGIPEKFSLKVSTPEKLLVDLSGMEMPVNWKIYFDAREEKANLDRIYDRLGVSAMGISGAQNFGPAGASYTFYLDNLKVEHYKEAIITISDAEPGDTATISSLNPSLSAKVVHAENKDMDITFSLQDSQGTWQEIKSLKGVTGGIHSVMTKDIRERNRIYIWKLTATDGTAVQEKEYVFKVLNYKGDQHTFIAYSECDQNPYIRRGHEPGRFYFSAMDNWHQSGAAYDVDKGWVGKFLSLPFLPHGSWGYWDSQYHIIGDLVYPTWSRIGQASCDTFLGLQQIDMVKHAREIALWRHYPWSTSSTYTFDNNRAWIMAVEYDEETKKGRVCYREWSKENEEKSLGWRGMGWADPVDIGVTPVWTRKVSLLQVDRKTWYLYVTVGEEPITGTWLQGDTTLRYFKTVDAGKTWSGLTDTGIPADIYQSHASFARYGDNYFVFLNTRKTSEKKGQVETYFSKDGENWDPASKRDVTPPESESWGPVWANPQGTLLNQTALIYVSSNIKAFRNRQFGIIVEIEELLAEPEKPVNISPENGSLFAPGTSEVTLEVLIQGPQTYDTAFYNGDGTFIETDRLLKNGDTARVKMSDLKPGTYQWYAISRGAVAEYYGEPCSTSDEAWSDLYEFTIQE